MSNVNPRWTYAELREAFNSVRNPEYWQGPIRAIVESDKIAVIIEAIAYFTGEATSVRMALIPNRGLCYLVESVGFDGGPAKFLTQTKETE